MGEVVMRSAYFLSAMFLALLSSCATPGEADPGGGEAAEVSELSDYGDDARHAKRRDTLVVVVRHAEKATDDPADPSLSEEGLARAQELARVLADTNVSAVYTSQFRRTKQTAEPLAQAAGVVVEERPITAENVATYASDLAREIRDGHAGQTVLVVNHSNTVPDIVTALSGAAAAPIDESEFSRLYTVAIDRKGQARVVAARY
jgi:broad specificity phosphatase PhoE